MSLLRHTAIALCCTLGLASSASAQRASATQQDVLARTDAIAAEIGVMAQTLWQHSEIALREERSAAYLADLLEREGFRVERGVAGMPTAFVAEFGSGSPVIGILAEYDALPGIGNQAVPRRLVRDDGVLHGQGCGHNLFGAGSVGAAIALKRTLADRNIPGTLRLYGTPAEETLVGKTYMARDGLFDDLDAALEWHPDVGTGVTNAASQANNNFTVEFFGQAAHAAYDPWNGRSALDAVELLTHGVNMMREHVPPTARIHYVIPNAGEAPNVVPEYAKIWFFVRDKDRPSVESHYDWMLKIAEGAALATRTTHKVFLNTGVHEYLFNRPIQEVLQRNLELVGAPAFGAAEQEFARALQKELGVPEKGLDTAVRPLSPGVDPLQGGSTDVAEVSWIAPTAGITVTTAGTGLPWHSWATAASHGIEGASTAAVVAAKVLALTGLELFTDAGLRERSRAFFREASGGRPYRTPIPEGQKPPLP